MALQGGGIILALVAESVAERCEPVAVAHQLVPDEMPRLVAEMAEQRAVRLVHHRACQLACHVVRLGGADDDHPLLMPGHGRHDRAIGVDGVFEKIKDQAALGIFVAIGMRQVPAQEGIEQMPLRLADAPPALDAFCRVDIGDKPVVAAGRAETVLRSCRQRPVADIQFGVGAETHLPPGIRHHPPGVVGRLQRMHGHHLRHEAETVAAIDAGSVVEMDRKAAMVAGIKSHEFCPR